MADNSFTFEQGIFPDEGNIDWQQKTNFETLPISEGFNFPASLSGNWYPEPDIDLPIDIQEDLWQPQLNGNVVFEPNVLELMPAIPAEPFALPESLQPQAPDISKGLGQRKDRADLVSLQKFVAQSHRFMVLNGQLCVYHPPCWKNCPIWKLNE